MYSNHGSLCVCELMGVFINRTGLCVWVFGVRQALPRENSGPAACGPSLGMRGCCLSVCLHPCLFFKWLLYGECSVNACGMRTS